MTQVTHEDDCVRMEDVPYFCPSCAVKVLGEKGRKKPTSKSPRAQKRKPKPKKPAKPVKVKPEQPVKVKPEPAPDPVPSDGIKLKINLKNQPVKTPKPPKVAKAPKLRTEEFWNTGLEFEYSWNGVEEEDEWKVEEEEWKFEPC